MTLAQVETFDGFMVYLVSCVILVGIIWGFQTWDIRAIRKKITQAISMDLMFAHHGGHEYRPSVYAVWLASELQWRLRRRRSDVFRYPFILATVTFLLNGFEAVVMWIIQ